MNKLKLDVALEGGYDANYAYRKAVDWCQKYVTGEAVIEQVSVTTICMGCNDYPSVTVTFNISSNDFAGDAGQAATDIIAWK